jgi:hypothetical protein
MGYAFNNVTYSISAEQKTVKVKCTRVDSVTYTSSDELLSPSSVLNIQSLYDFWQEQVFNTAGTKLSTKYYWTPLMFCNVLSAQVWHRRIDDPKRNVRKPNNSPADNELDGVCLVMHTLYWEYMYQNLSAPTKLALRDMLFTLDWSKDVWLREHETANKHDWQCPGLVFPEISWLN